jgi:hypothetical protein
MENEVFVDIENYEGLYRISSFGRVYSVKRNKFLKPKKDKDNYLLVNLYKNGKRKNYKIHRLVAQAFLPNPSNLPQVNHKDENPSNNHLENLEWCDAKYNCNYGSRTERAISKMVQNPNYQATREKSLKAAHEKLSKPVLQFDKQGKFVAEFPSTREAERATGIYQSNISNCCLEKYKSAGKYLWRFKEEEVA